MIQQTPEKRIIIDDAVPYAEAMFSHLGKVILMPGRDIDAASVKHADALIVRSRTQVNADLLNQSRVKFVGSTVVGLDHVDQAWLSQQGIHFYSAQGCNANSVAEYIIAGLLQLAQDHHFTLSEKTLGIIGVGHVGKLVQIKAQALGINCLLNDPPRARAESNAEFVELNTLLNQADIITVHTPLTTDGLDPTAQLLNADNMTLLKPNVIVINAARGGIIDEQAWCNTPTLANIIDCWDNEPFINADLYAKADYATPHIAGHSLEAKINGSSMVYQQLCAFWQITPRTEWQALLPPAPAALQMPASISDMQNSLHQLIKQTYDLRIDDAAIRHEQITAVHNQFETYRRHYPIRREWPNYKVADPIASELKSPLKSLGFQVD